MSTRYRFLAATFALAALAPFSARAVIGVQEQTQGPVSFVSGGIGADEAEAMRQAAPSYALALEMATAAGGPRDAYIANAKVDIRDAHGNTVLDTTAQGPFLLVRLPPGTYKVAVNWSGTEREKIVDVSPEHHQHVMMEFPDVPGNH